MHINPGCFLLSKLVLLLFTNAEYRQFLRFGIVENCYLKSQILPQKSPNFATKIEKFATFCQQNYQILQIKLNNRITFFLFPETQNITFTQRCAQNVTQVHIRKKIKTRVPKFAKTEREASKFNNTRYS